jgi:hypothetical protein
MMKLHVLALAALAALPAVASAQTQTATINVVAKVQSSVSFSNTTNLDFGAAITPGTAATVTAANGGKVMVSYNTPTTVTVAGTALTHSASAATIPVTYSCAQATTGTATTPTAFAGTCAAGYTTALNGNARTTHWIYLGGDIAASATTTAPAGNYAGTATFTATYTTY